MGGEATANGRFLACFCELHPTDQVANRDDPEVEGANVAGQDDPVDPTAEVLE